MAKVLLFISILAVTLCSHSYSQKKYGYAVLHFRCGKQEPQKNRIYYSPVIELNILNFARYTAGMDPSFPKYSTRYYNYAITKWFEFYLQDHYNISVNDPEKYQRNDECVVFDDKKNGDCNDDKTQPGCFFTDKQKLLMQRNNAISENKLPKHTREICEVISL